MTKHMAKLSNLPYDLLINIAKQFKKLEDFIIFTSSSKSLHIAVKHEYFDGLPFRQHIPYLMLPVKEEEEEEDGNDNNNNTRDIYSLVEGESIVASFKLPNLKSKKCFESLGWLLVVQEDGNMSLLEPFSGTEIPVPHQNTLAQYEELELDAHIFIQKMVLSSRPSETSDFILMIVAGSFGHLAYWRSGEKEWKLIENRNGRFRDVVYGGGEVFYAISNPGIVWVFNLARNDNNIEDPTIINCEPWVCHDYRVNMYILRKVDGTLLMIVRTVPNEVDDLDSYETIDFDLYEVDIATATCKEIDSLGSMALFIGENSTIIVDALRLPGGVIKPNHIYYTDDNWEFYHFKSKGGGADIGVYNIETGDFDPIYPGEPLLSRVSPSTWITPYFSECY